MGRGLTAAQGAHVSEVTATLYIFPTLLITNYILKELNLHHNNSTIGLFIRHARNNTKISIPKISNFFFQTLEKNFRRKFFLSNFV